MQKNVKFRNSSFFRVLSSFLHKFKIIYVNFKLHFAVKIDSTFKIRSNNTWCYQYANVAQILFLRYETVQKFSPVWNSAHHKFRPT